MTTLLICLSAVVAAMVVLWIISVICRDASIVDPFWGTGFVLVVWLAIALNSPGGFRPYLLGILTTVWGIRLSAHLMIRNFGHGEDRRYGEMREKHGAQFWWVSLFTVFLLQALILWFVALPLQIVADLSMESGFGWLDGIGIMVWGVGFFFEAVGDWQLARFRAQPENKGEVMDRGLWRYTRHPNYFGDFCVWWGLYLIAVAGGAVWTIASPVLMSFFLMRLSGVTLLEKTIRSRRPGYQAYQAKTNAFFPGPPRSSAATS